MNSEYLTAVFGWSPQAPMMSTCLGRVTSGKLVCNEVNEVKSINDKILTHTFYNKKNFMKVSNTYG